MCSANDGAVRRGARGLAEAAARRDTLASILARSVLLILQRVFSGTAQPFRCPPTHTLLITVTITHCMAVSVAGLHCTTTHTHISSGPCLSRSIQARNIPWLAAPLSYCAALQPFLLSCLSHFAGFIYRVSYILRHFWRGLKIQCIK